MSLSSWSSSLRQRQKDAIIAMLNFNNRDALQQQQQQPPPVAGSESPAFALNIQAEVVWKVLIYDHACQEIISPLLKVNELRENGVTVHMALNAERQPIPDVPAVYFVVPTPENIRRIGDDLTKNLYETFYINFSSALPRALLEDLAAATIAANARVKIAQVYDQYLNFVSLDHSLFSGNFGDTYRVLNDAGSSDTTIESMADKIVGSLFSMLVTQGVVPIIRCPAGNAAAVVAAKLDARLRDHITNTRGGGNLFSESLVSSSSISRPCLILLDRNFDLSTMLSHTWTYSTLVHDVLDMKLNRVTIEIEEKNHKIKKSYDLDVNDFFWAKNSGNPFPQVAEDVSAELNRYKKDVDEVTRSSGVTSLDEVDASAPNAQNLKLAITALPELTERKRILDMHMNIATSLFKQIGDRKLDAFFSIEESLGKQSKAAVLEAIKDPSKSVDDKLRLLLMYFLTVEDAPKDDIASMEDALRIAGASSTAALAYVRNVRTFTKMAAASNVPAPSSTGTFLDRIGSSLAGRLEGTGVSGHFDSLLSGVKNLLPSRKDLPITRIVETVMDSTVSAAPEVDDFLYFDPRQGKSGSGGRAPKGKVAFQESIVFVIGGGNYLEYQNLLDFAARSTPKRKVTYGSTEILTASQFLSLLTQLGTK